MRDVRVLALERQEHVADDPEPGIGVVRSLGAKPHRRAVQAAGAVFLGVRPAGVPRETSHHRARVALPRDDVAENIGPERADVDRRGIGADHLDDLEAEGGVLRDRSFSLVRGEPKVSLVSVRVALWRHRGLGSERRASPPRLASLLRTFASMTNPPDLPRSPALIVPPAQPEGIFVPGPDILSSPLGCDRRGAFAGWGTLSFG